jgi:cytochrome c oxidase assembly protein Cox11
MIINRKKYLKLFFVLFLLIVVFLLTNIFIKKLNKDTLKAKEPIIINLITSVHPDLPWSFRALNKKIIIKPGDVTTIEYIVENLQNSILLVLQHLLTFLINLEHI